MLQSEIAEASTQAQMRFYQAFPDKSQWTANSVQQYINEAVRQCKASTISELKRQLAVADPKLTDDFLGTVKKHYEMFEHSPEMTLQTQCDRM